MPRRRRCLSSSGRESVARQARTREAHVDVDRFKSMVARLERESAAAPAAYRIKVAALTLLGFGILALVLGLAGLGIVLLGGFVVAVVLTGGTALLLLLKLGKLLFFLAIPLWYLIKASVQALAVRVPVPQGREIARAQAPALFAAIDDMRRKMHGPRFHHVLVVDGVNAAVVQRPAFGLVGWPRNYLLLGLPLLESMPPEEALAVVAHEYGHLAGSHGRFSAFIYRLRHTWGTVQAYTDHIQGWLGGLVAPLVRWYAPYFNAYTFVLARADEYQADAASAELVGAANAAHALKRVNVIAPQHRRFMEQTFDRIAHEPAPPRDLMQRWAAQATAPVPGADAARWLEDALDREGHFTDSHPTLRARLQALAALPASPEPLEVPPPPVAGATAAAAWLGPLLEALRGEFQSTWAEEVQQPWAERHAEALKQRARLAELAAIETRTADEELERLRLTLRLEPEADLREPLAAFNAQHADHAVGLFLEGRVRLGKQDAAGIALLERAMALDPEATKPVCELVHAFLQGRGDEAAAESWAERWRQRDALETLRGQQLARLDANDELAPHGLDEATLATVRQVVLGHPRAHVTEVYLARRVVPADPSVVQLVLGLHLTWWSRRRGKQAEVVKHYAALAWPVGLVVVTLDGQYKYWREKFQALPGARLA